MLDWLLLVLAVVPTPADPVAVTVAAPELTLPVAVPVG